MVTPCLYSPYRTVDEPYSKPERASVTMALAADLRSFLAVE